MSGDRPNRQFRLWRLFFWTGLAALMLSTVRTLGGQAAELTMALSLLLLLGTVDVLRAVLGAWSAFLLWIVGATALGVLFWLLPLPELVTSGALGSAALGLTACATGGCILGMLAWLPAEVFFQTLDWVDRFLQVRGDG